jgi:DNA-binding LytR/AlgR family response regulator
MNAVIADDEPVLAQYLSDRLARLWPELKIAAVVDSGPAAIAAIAEHRPDIAFLDIRMPGTTGLQVAEGIGRGTRVVFVTAYDQYALEAFERDAVDYLLKPVTDERLLRTIGKLKSAGAPAADLAPLLAQLSQHLSEKSRTQRLRWIRASKRAHGEEITQQIAVADVLYFQADDKYTCVFAREGKEIVEWLIRVPLSELASQLDTDDFAQIHRSVIVNLRRVSQVTRGPNDSADVHLQGRSERLPVSRSFLHLFRQM